MNCCLLTLMQLLLKSCSIKYATAIVSLPEYGNEVL